MKKSSKTLLWLLPLVLVACIAVGILIDPGTWANTAPAGEYHIQITEVCAKNESIIPDNDGKFRDYIEIYNAGETVDLTGCRLTDGSTRSKPFQNFLLETNSYRVLFLGKDTTGFALSASGRDSVQLLDPSGKVIAQAKIRTLGADQAMVLKSGAYQITSEPTHGFSNDEKGRAAFLTGEKKGSLDVVISEILLENRVILPDEKGRYSDVVELCNPTGNDIHLGGWCLSDDETQRFRFRLPEITLPAGGYTVIFCDGEGYTDGDYVHAGFGLTGDETLYLTDPTGAYTAVALGYTPKNTSLALTAEGYMESEPSLGFPNTEEGCYAAQQARVNTNSPLVINEVLLSDAGVPYKGILQDVVEIYNRSQAAVSTKGWYLSDGGDPYGFQLPETELASGAFLAIPISKGTAGFGLAVGETVYLIGPDHLWSQPVSCVTPELGKSICLVDPSQTLSYDFDAPSLGYVNHTAGKEAFVEQQLVGDLRISEAMSSNSSYLSGPYGNTTDWVELYNAGKETIDLSQYCLSDAPNGTQHPLPNKTVAPGGYICILLSESGRRLKAGYGWLPFSLSAAGDSLYLTKNGEIQDYAILPELSGDEAWGRPNGELNFTKLASATPGSKNAGEARISEAPVANVPQGAYDGVSSLQVTLSAKGEIYYTTDCTAPTKSDKKYTGPITLKKTTVLRVAAYEPGCSRSQVVDLTYLINENDNLNTVCLVANPHSLFDYYDGIYATGPNASDVNPFVGANFWRNV